MSLSYPTQPALWEASCRFSFVNDFLELVSQQLINRKSTREGLNVVA